MGFIGKYQENLFLPFYKNKERNILFHVIFIDVISYHAYAYMF